MAEWRKAAPGPFRRLGTITGFLRDSALDAHDLVETAPRTVRPPAPPPRAEGVALPPPGGSLGGSTTLDEVRAARTSAWPDAGRPPLTATEVATLLHAVFGPPTPDARDADRRGYPSPGRAYAVEPWVWAPSVSPGTVGPYDPASRTLVTDVPTSVAGIDALTPSTRFGQSTFATAGLVVFLVGRVPALHPRYGALALRLLLLEAGHVGSALQTAATALRRSSMPLGGFFDRLVTEELRLRDGEHCLYVWSIG